MSSNVTPPWLRDETLEDVQPLNQTNFSGSGISPYPSNNAPSQSQAQPTSISPIQEKIPLILMTLKGVTMLLCILMAATAVIGIEYISGVDTSGKLFVAAYMFFFATMLFVFEALEFRQVEWLDRLYRRNFGFLYGALGKAFFIIFIAFLCFGLGDPQSLTMATGASLALFGFLEVGLYLKYPEIFDRTPVGNQ